MTPDSPTEQMSPTPQTSMTPQTVEPWTPPGYAAMSLLVPGLGQLMQHRPVAAALQFATVGSYVVTAYALGGGRALWLALLWNTWSAVDAYWRSPR
jgi:TM2 domain-containing membrane protein YozV